MLSKSAIKEFRNRELGSFNFMKDLSRKQLLRMVDELDPKPEFISKDPLWDHQLVSFLIAVYTKQVLLYLSMGLGKTRVILEIIAYLKQTNDLKRALIVVPNNPAVETWIMEAERHRSDIECVPMYGSTTKKYNLLREEADVFVVPYTGLNYMCSERVKGFDNRKNKQVVSRQHLNMVGSQFNFICLDEVTNIKNTQTLSYQVCRRISNDYEYRIGMAGIPTGRDPQDLWAQFAFCDHGETLGETLGIFRESFFKRTTNYWSGYYDYSFDPKWKNKLHKVIQNRSIHYSEGECRDMPPLVHKTIYVPFEKDMKAYYNKIVDQINANKNKGGQEDRLRLVRGSFLHMRQLASGFIGLIDDESGERVQVEFPNNPKIEAIVQLLEEIPKNRKFLIYHEFIWTGNRIAAELNKLGIKYGRLRGGQKDTSEVLRDFIKNKTLRCLIIQNRIGSFALNLQVANYLIFMESPVSPIVRGQAEKRIHRGSQKRKCHIIDILMHKNTADESIQDYIKEGKNIEQALMHGKRLKFKKV